MVRIKIDLGPWRAKFRRTGDALRGLHRIDVVAEDGAHAAKLAASKGRGDTLEMSGGAMADCKRILARGIRDIMMGTSESIDGTAMALGDRLVEDASEGVREGRVDGPQRSAAWIKQKHNDINDYGDGRQGGHMCDHFRAVRS